MTLMIKRFFVEYDGRYKVDSNHKAKSDAEVLAARITEKRTAVKCQLTLKEYEFHIGKKKPLYKISKKVFHFKDLDRIFTISIYPTTIILLHQHKESSWFSYIKFLCLPEMEHFVENVVKKLNVSMEDIYRTDTFESEYCSVVHSVLCIPTNDIEEVVERPEKVSETREVLVEDHRERFVRNSLSLDRLYQRSPSTSLSIASVSSEEGDELKWMQREDPDLLIINDSIYMMCKIVGESARYDYSSSDDSVDHTP